MRSTAMPGGPALLILIAAAFASAALPPASPEAGEVRIGYIFESPAVRTDSRGYSTIEFTGTRQSGGTGGPTYPYRGIRVLLPPGQVPGVVRFEKSGWKELPGRMTLAPRQRQVPGDRLADETAPFDADREFVIDRPAYEVDRWVQPPRSDLSVHYMRGHAIATGTFTPVAYHPSARSAGYYSRVTLVIETVPAGGTKRLPGPAPLDRETVDWLLSSVDNPSDVPSPLFAAGGTPSTPLAYDYMIVTSEALEESFEPLCDFYNMMGIRTRTVTCEDIEARFAGRDLCEKVRTAIIHNYSDYGIRLVLLGGDVGVVPYRGFTCTVDSDGELAPDDGISATVKVDNRIPSDIYFSNLDGDWNDDGDILWGEPGEEDLYSEVSVGRACVDTPAEAAAFVHKSVTYQGAPVAEHLERVLLLGEKLADDPLTWGADDLDELVDTCQAHGYSTTGIPPGFEITEFYDRELGDWGGSDVVIPQVNAGTHWIFHVGHCNSAYGLRLGENTITDYNFLNDGVGENYPIINTIGCLLGSFELSDCIAEMMVGIDHFALAMVCNSRYGWFSPGSTDGVSHHYQREFADAIFGEGLTRLGPAHARSKDDTAVYLTLPGYAEEGVMRWCFYCLNLLGDPAVDAWTGIPSAITASHSGAIESGDERYYVSTGVPGCIGALSTGGDLLAVAEADAAGELSFDLAGCLPSGCDTVTLCLRSHDRLPLTETVTVHQLSEAEVPVPASALLGCSPNPFNPSTTISYSIAERGTVELRIFDAAGREVDRIYEGERGPGVHRAVWSPGEAASGVYLCVLRYGGETSSIKLVLVR